MKKNSWETFIEEKNLWSTLTGCEFITSSNAVEKKQY